MTKAGEVAILHYSAPPVVGGVEAVMNAQARLLLEHGFGVKIIAGQGDLTALPEGARLALLPELSSQHADILRLQEDLDRGSLPPSFEPMTEHVYSRLRQALAGAKWVIVHNVFTKHFNLAFTSALARLLAEGLLPGCLAWCHDFSWSSPGSKDRVHPGPPWDLLRTPLPGARYVTVSDARRAELAGLFGVQPDSIRVVYNGVEQRAVLGLSEEGDGLARRLRLFSHDPILLMPVRVTAAKNIQFALNVTHSLRASGLHPLTLVTGPPDPHNADNRALYQELLGLRRQLGLEEGFRFVYECGTEPGQAYTISETVVGDLYRCSDLVFIPSLREGFGMPVVEAGLAGVPVVCSQAVPAGVEIGGADVLRIDLEEGPESAARKISDWLNVIPTARMKRRARGLTWEAIYERDMAGLLGRGP